MEFDHAPIDEESLKNLSDAELAELAEAYEQLHLDEQRTNIVAFALNTEVPGTPSPYSENDRIKLLKRKEAMQRRRVSSTEYEDFDDVESEEPDVVEFYPQQLEIAAHQQLILEAMQALMEEEPIIGPLANGHDGVVPDGVIFLMPPGSAKSTYASVIAPAWVAGRYPGTDIISLSYGADLARRFGRRVRHICRQPKYERQMECTVVTDNAAVDQWSLTNGSTYKATGILGGVTGNRADLCLVANTQLDTPNGPRRIDQIRKGDYVLSYDHEHTHRAVYRRVAGVARRPTDEIWRVRAASGHLVEATGNHPFFTGGTWTQAASLAVGDVLLRSVRHAEAHSSLRSGEGPIASDVLQHGLRNQGTQPKARNAGSLLHKLQQAVGRHVARCSRLLTRVPFGGSHAARGETARPRSAAAMRDVRQGVQAANQHDAWTLLLARLQGLWSRFAGGWSNEPQLATWPRPQSLSGGQWAEVQGRQEAGAGAGWWLRGLLRQGETPGPSCGRRQQEQCAGERRDSMRPMSLDAAWSGARETAADSVAMVERVRQDCFVYDIEVDDTHCFFANGILVHNCVVDDPIAGREEAESEIIREKTWQAFSDDVLTRLKPRGKVALILTHWHEDDPAGRILGDKWEGQSGLWRKTDELEQEGDRWWLVIRIPLVCDSDDDVLGRARGERLWPEWFTDKHVRFAKAAGERSWNSLQQQKPSASDGNILLKSAWRCWPHGKAEPTDDQKRNPNDTRPPEFGVWKQCTLFYDTALKDEEQNDYSAMTAWLSFEKTIKIPQRKMAEEAQQNMLLTGAWRARVQASQLLGIVLDHIKQFKPDRVVIEDKASGIQLIQELRARRPRHEYGEVLIEAWLPEGKRGTTDKVSRAWGASLLLNEGATWYMPGPQIEAVIKECASFPNGRYDDWCDTVTMALLYARKTNMLEMSADALSDVEQHEADEEEYQALNNPRPSYGHSRSKPYTQASRNLYGRA